MIATVAAARTTVTAFGIPTATALKAVTEAGERLGWTFDYTGTGAHFGFVTTTGIVSTQPWGDRANAAWRLGHAVAAEAIGPVDADGLPQCRNTSASHQTGTQGWSGCEAGRRQALIEDWRRRIVELGAQREACLRRGERGRRGAANLARLIAEETGRLERMRARLAAEAHACECDTVWDTRGQHRVPTDRDGRPLLTLAEVETARAEGRY